MPAFFQAGDTVEDAGLQCPFSDRSFDRRRAVTRALRPDACAPLYRRAMAGSERRGSGRYLAGEADVTLGRAMRPDQSQHRPVGQSRRPKAVKAEREGRARENAPSSHVHMINHLGGQPARRVEQLVPGTLAHASASRPAILSTSHPYVIRTEHLHSYSTSGASPRQKHCDVECRSPASQTRGTRHGVDLSGERVEPTGAQRRFRQG